MANATITNPYFSKIENPQGFPHWFNFTPSWTANTTNPSLGTGTFTGRFCINGSKLTVNYHLVMGSNTTYGSGFWKFSLPVSVLGSGATTKQYGYGHFEASDSSGSGWGSASAYALTTSEIVFDAEQSRANWNATVPFTWATNDQIYGQFVGNI